MIEGVMANFVARHEGNTWDFSEKVLTEVSSVR